MRTQNCGKRIYHYLFLSYNRRTSMCCILKRYFVFVGLILPSSSYICINPSPVQRGLRLSKLTSKQCRYHSQSNNDLFSLKLSGKRITDGKTHHRDQSSMSIHKYTTDPSRKLLSSLSDILKRKRLKRALCLSLAAVFLHCFLMLPLESASAVPSGGRMGGSFGGSSRESSSVYPSNSRQYLYSRPSVTISPSPWYGYSPFYPPPLLPSPFYRPGLTVVTGGPNVVGLLMFFFVGLGSIAGFISSFQTTRVRDYPFNTALGSGVTVSKISVALHVPERTTSKNILRFLNSLSSMSNTDSRVGVSNLINQGE